MAHITQQGTPVLRYAAIMLLCFAVGLAGAWSQQHWNTIATLFHEAYQTRDEIMTGQRGPVTYLVFAEDFHQLSQWAEPHPDIMGVERSLESNVAKVAFVSAQSPMIESMAALPFVSDMVRRDVEMLCH